MVLFTNSLALRGFCELWGEVMQHWGVNISTTLLGHHQCHTKSFIHIYLQNKFDVSRLGAVKVHVYVTNQALVCDLDAPPLSSSPSTPHRKEWHKTPKQKKKKKRNIQFSAWTPPLSSSPNAIIKASSPGCEGLSHRQPVSGGSPIAFVHFFFSPSFSAEHLLPWGRVRPVPVLLRLDNAETTKMKSLEEDVNNFPHPEPPTFQWSSSLWVEIKEQSESSWNIYFFII